jgi:hypothetical protein
VDVHLRREWSTGREQVVCGSPASAPVHRDRDADPVTQKEMVIASLLVKPGKVKR